MSKAHTHRWLVASIVSAFLALSSWAISSPIGSSPDDDFHLSSIWCGQGIREGLCEVGTGERGDYMVPSTVLANAGCFAFQSSNSGECFYDESLYETPRVNQSAQLYPVVYYWTLSWLASKDLYFSTISMRLFNVLIAVFLVVLLVTYMPQAQKRIPLISFAISSVPLGVYLLASNNPSSWSYLAVVALFSSTLGFFITDKPLNRLPLGLISLVTLIMAAGSRTDSAIYSIIAISLAALLAFSRQAITAINITFAFLLTLIAASFFFLSTSGGAYTQELANSTSDAPAGTSILFNLAELPSLWIGVFGSWGLGWLDTVLPPAVWITTYFVYASVVFSAMRYFDFKQYLAAFLAALSLVILPMYVLTRYGLSVGQTVQPRYLLPLLGLLAAVALYRKHSSDGLSFSRGQVWMIGTGLIFANSLALNVNLRRYISGQDVRSFDLDNAVEWWWAGLPVSPSFVWAAGSIFFALLLISIWKLRHVFGLPVEERRIEPKTPKI